MKNLLLVSIFIAICAVGAIAGIQSCGSASYVTKASTHSIQNSLDNYFIERQEAGLFRGSLHDSVDAWAATDTSVTKFVAKDFAQMRHNDSLGAYSPNYYQYARQMADNKLNQILSIAK